MEYPGPLGNRRRRGRAGEAAAAEHLTAKGYRILDRNYAKRAGEIDLVARDPADVLVFVEVKTAFGKMAGDPAFWVHRRKQRQIGRVAEIYLAERGITPRPCRFDVLTVMMGEGKSPRVVHYENAFMLG